MWMVLHLHEQMIWHWSVPMYPHHEIAHLDCHSMMHQQLLKAGNVTDATPCWSWDWMREEQPYCWRGTMVEILTEMFVVVVASAVDIAGIASMG